MATILSVHIGARKTGTTFVQRALETLAPELLSHGVLYPTHYRPGKGDYNHVAAVYEVMRAAGRATGRWQDLPLGTHQALADAVNSHDGPAVISAEALSGLPRSDIEAFLAPFDAPVRVIASARDLGRVLPSSWQQHVRNTHAMPFEDYLQLRGEQRAAGALEWETGERFSFWRMFSYGRLVRRWESVTGVGSVHLVTAPRPGAAASDLWQRFCDAAALPAEVRAVSPVVPALTANTGSTAAEAAFLVAYNERARSLNIDRRELKRMQHKVVSALVHREDRGQPLRLPQAWLEPVRMWAKEDLSDLESTGAAVHGAREDLEVLDSAAEEHPVTAAEIASVGAFVALHQERPDSSSSMWKIARRLRSR